MNINVSDVKYPEIRDPKDCRFFAVAMTGRLSEDPVLVTGNMRHFPIKAFVITPAQFVEMLQEMVYHVDDSPWKDHNTQPFLKMS